MIEQKIRLCKQRLARTKREEHHQPSKKQSHGGGASEGSKIREKGSGFKFAGAAVAAQNKMKMLVKEGGKVSETAAAPAVEEAAVAQAMAAADAEKAKADAKAKAEADAAAKAKAKAEADAAAKAEADAAAKSKADADAAAAAKADAEKKAAEKAAAEQAAAADKAAADEAAKKKAALVRKKAKAAAAAKPVPSKKAAPKKSPRPSSPKPEPTPTWLPVAVLGGIGAILFAVLAIGGGDPSLGRERGAGKRVDEIIIYLTTKIRWRRLACARSAQRRVRVKKVTRFDACALLTTAGALHPCVRRIRSFARVVVGPKALG